MFPLYCLVSQYELSGLAMSEEEGALDDDFMFLYDNVDGYRFFLGEVPWEWVLGS